MAQKTKAVKAATPDRCSPLDVQRATEMLWRLLAGNDSPFITLQHRSIVMCKLMDQLASDATETSEPGQDDEFWALSAHAHDVEASRRAVQDQIESAYRFLSGDPQLKDVEASGKGGAR